MTSHWSGSRRRVCADLKFAGEQAMHSSVVLDDHDQVNALDANLQAPAAACNGEEHRCAPSGRCAAGGHTASIFGADDEAAFEHMGNNGYAFRMLQNFFGDALVWRSHNLVQHVSCMLHPVVCCFAIGSRPSHAG